ncbi:hypothetical protein N9R43_01895 [bacterium]|nr:hypothetical protein [bacterium]
MDLIELKKVNEMFFAVKGHLFPTTYTVNEMRSVYNSYFTRMWGNNEFYLHVEQFEDVWKNRTAWLNATV